MNPDQTRRECITCGESEPSFIHTTNKTGVFRRLCTDCLLKENRQLFCPICLIPFLNDLPPPNARIICLNCSSITHLDCSLPPPSSFTCPPCSDPNFSFFPKSHLPTNGETTVETELDAKSGQALVTAAEIAVVSMNSAVVRLKDQAVKKILEAKMAKMKVKDALTNLQDLVLKQKGLEGSNPNKRKNSEV